MIGQGGPRTSRRGRSAWAPSRIWGKGRGWLLVGLLCLVGVRAEAETLRLRLAWGGGEERLWHGTVAVRNGTLLEPQSLGIEADEAGSMWLEEGQLAIAQRSPRGYDGVELLVEAPLSASLVIRLASGDEEAQGPPREIPLADLVQREVNAKLDEHGNRLSVRRAPGDQLRVHLDQRTLVFGPGERLSGKIEPHLLPMEAGAKVRLTSRLLPARTPSESWSSEHPLRAQPDLWSNEQTFVVGEAEPLPLDVPLPEQEGTYDLVLKVTPSRWIQLPQASRAAQMLNQLAVERRLQVIVVRPDRPAVRAEGELRQVVEIDPADLQWWKRYATSQLPRLPKLQNFWKGPLGNDRIQPVQHPSLGKLAQLAPSPENDVSWEAYTLPINQPGCPHVLELDYPSDAVQTLGISIIEPNAAGAVIPIGLDSGIEQSEELVTEERAPQWLHHRLIFWPRTKSPIVLITNRRSDVPAVFGRIRVLGGWSHLPPAFAASPAPAGRLWAAYMDRPLVPENFSATEAVGALSDLSVDDWQTFHEGGTRLVEYLNHVGYNGLMLSVLADGSTIFPSKTLEPTPRYDTGVFFATGQDPVRKDVLELLLRLLDREHLQLIPAVDFSCPLPALEAILRAGGTESEGIQWVGDDGKVWTQRYAPLRGMAAYYNLLDPQVQEAMLAVLHELVANYAEHPAFAGLAVQLSGNGYAVLPGPRWGMDDATIARFQHDTQVVVPGSGPSRFAQRAEFLDGPGRAAWLEWRAAQVTRFYQRVRDVLRAKRPEARLYLAGANLFSGEEAARDLLPTLPRRMSMTQALLRVGIDVAQYQQDPAVVLLRPEVTVPEWALGTGAVSQEARQMPDWDRLFAGLPQRGTLFYHRPQEVRITSFDERSPIRPTYTWLATQPVPSGLQNRRRFVHVLATLDPQVILDGGWELAMGQEGAVKDLVALYRRLPALPFEPISPASQPVTIRLATDGERTWAYAVNDAPFASELRVRVKAPAGCSLEELTGLRRVPPLARDAQGAYWQLNLAPYEVVGVVFSAAGVQLSEPTVHWSDKVYAALQRRIADLGDRTAVLKHPPSLKTLRNGDFEQPSTSEALPAWSVQAKPGAKATLDRTQKHGGAQAVHLSSTGSPLLLASDRFVVPNTGRLTIDVWVRVADPGKPMRLWVAAEGSHHNAYFIRGKDIPALPDAQWNWYRININDLPLEGLSPLRLRFDTVGAGDIWIDDIRLEALSFSLEENFALLKLLAPADIKLQNGQVADCLELLEGYWPHFLIRNVPLPEIPISQRPDSPPRAAENPEDPAGKGLMGRMKQWLPEKFR